jgi:hypothetical protein
MPSWKRVIVSGSDAALNSLNVTSHFTASGINYPTTDGTVGQVIITDGAGNLSFSPVENTTIVIKNVSGATIAKGTPCYITGSGTSGNLAGVWPADAANPARMPAGVIAGETLIAGAEGVGLINGFIANVNTSAFSAGNSIYVAVGGGYTNVRPTGSGVLIQKLGNVEKSHATNGSGVINGPAYYNEVPNIQQGFTWVGNGNGVAIAVATSSIQNVVSSSYALTAATASNGSNTFTIGSNKIFSQYNSGGTANDALKLSTTNLGAVFGVQNTNASGFSGIEYIDNSNAVKVFTGYNNSGNGEFRFNNIASNGFITFKIGSSDKLTIANTGNVGIGTTSPDARLSVVQDITTTAEFGSFGQFTLQGATNPAKLLSFGFNTFTDAGFIQAMINGVSYNNLLLNARGGNVGIGTTSPSYKLDVKGTIFSSGSFGDRGVEDAYRLKFFDNGGIANDPGIGLDGIVGGEQMWFNSLDGFYWSTGTGGEKVRITSAGNVGIGTTTPNAKLDVNGNAIITGSLTVTGRITAEEFHTEFVSSSIVYQSGSTKFGDSSDDVMSVTGSLRVNGSITGSLQGTASFATTASYVNTLNQNVIVNGNFDSLGTGVIGSATSLASYTIEDGVSSMMDYDQIDTWAPYTVTGEILWNEPFDDTVIKGQLVTKTAAGWVLADNRVGTGIFSYMLGIALTNAGPSDNGGVLLKGIVTSEYNVDQSSAASGTPVYMDGSSDNGAGYMVSTAPSSTGRTVRIVGYTYINSSNQTGGQYVLRFDPSSTWLEL